MDSQDEQDSASLENAEAVGVLLADAFIARVSRFPPAQRTRLLSACHHRLLQGDQEISWLLFCGQPLYPPAEELPQEDAVQPQPPMENA